MRALWSSLTPEGRMLVGLLVLLGAELVVWALLDLWVYRGAP